MTVVLIYVLLKVVQHFRGQHLEIGLVFSEDDLHGKVMYRSRRLQPAHLVSCIIRGGTANINFVHNNRA